MNTWSKFVFLGLIFLKAICHAEGGFGVDLSDSTYGLYVFAAFTDKVGWYGDLSSSRNSVNDKNVYSFSKTYAETVLGDPRVGTTKNVTAFSAGPLFSLSFIHDLLYSTYIYGALAIGGENSYATYYDNTGILGSNNNYYLKDGNQTVFGAGIGIIQNFEKWGLKLSYASISKQISVGISIGFNSL